jgi:hypothetical protein
MIELTLIAVAVGVLLGLCRSFGNFEEGVRIDGSINALREAEELKKGKS